MKTCRAAGARRTGRPARVATALSRDREGPSSSQGRSEGKRRRLERLSVRLGLGPVEARREMDDPITGNINVQLVRVAAPTPELLDLAVGESSRCRGGRGATAEAVAGVLGAVVAEGLQEHLEALDEEVPGERGVDLQSREQRVLNPVGRRPSTTGSNYWECSRILTWRGWVGW